MYAAPLVFSDAGAAAILRAEVSKSFLDGGGGGAGAGAIFHIWLRACLHSVAFSVVVVVVEDDGDVGGT